jgi:hypothetical protein
MTQPPYPLLPTPLKKGWFERHPRWKIPLGCLTLIVLAGCFAAGVMTLVFTSFHKSDVFQQAMAKAKDNVQVRDAMGEPIRAAWMVMGNLHINGGSGSADMAIPISGPRGKAVIRLVAHKDGGVWKFTFLQVTINGRDGNIDLLSIQPPPEREF